MENRPSDERLRRLHDMEQGERARAIGERPSLIINRGERADEAPAGGAGEQPALWRWHVRRRVRAKG